MTVASPSVQSYRIQPLILPGRTALGSALQYLPPIKPRRVQGRKEHGRLIRSIKELKSFWASSASILSYKHPQADALMYQPI